MGHYATLTTPFYRRFVNRKFRLDIVYLCEFNDSSFSHSIDIIWAAKFNMDHAHSKGDLSSMCLYLV